MQTRVLLKLSFALILLCCMVTSAQDIPFITPDEPVLVEVVGESLSNIAYETDQPVTLRIIARSLSTVDPLIRALGTGGTVLAVNDNHGSSLSLARIDALIELELEPSVIVIQVRDSSGVESGIVSVMIEEDPVAQATGTPANPMGITLTSANLRSGPGTDYDPPIGLIPADEDVEIIAVDPTGDWLKIRYLDRESWIRADLVQTSVDLFTMPIVAVPPPTPDTTSTPTFEEEPYNPPSDRTQIPPQAIRLSSGIGMTTDRLLTEGRMEVEGYCTNWGTVPSYDDANWYCDDLQLTPEHFDSICHETYRNPYAFALQVGTDVPAFSWSCFIHPDFLVLPVRQPAVGELARVFTPSGYTVRIREEPDNSLEPIGYIGDGGIVRILEGPRDIANTYVWRVRATSLFTLESVDGWIAGAIQVDPFRGFPILWPLIKP